MGLEHVDFVLALEDRLSIRVPSARMERVRAVGDAEEMVLSLVRETGRAFEEHTVRWQVRELIADETAIEIDRIRPEMRLIEDLGWG